MSSEINIQPFDPVSASTSSFKYLNRFENLLLEEKLDHSRTIEDTIKAWKLPTQFLEIQLWIVTYQSDNNIIAGAWVAFRRNFDDNQHIANFHIHVLPNYRQEGIAKQLLSRIAQRAKIQNPNLLMTNTYSMIPSGQIFMNRLGAEVGTTTQENQLNLKKINPKILFKWQDHQLGDQFQLDLWEGDYPQEDIQHMIMLKELMNTAPVDNLKIEDKKWTLEQIKEEENILTKKKIIRWTMYVRCIKTGEIIGYTELFRFENHTKIMSQGDTGVLPKYHNHGIGRWLKAAMIEKMIQIFPQAKYIRTANANSNTAMLKINRELGFEPYRTSTIWQIEFEKINKYLEKMT